MHRVRDDIERVEMQSSIEYARLASWVESSAFEGVAISLAPHGERSLARLAVPVTTIRIEGRKTGVDEALRALAFMSAGG